VPAPAECSPRYAPTTPALRTLLVLVVLSLLPACGGATGDGGDEPGAAAQRGPSEPLVVLVRYGGTTGATDRVAVDALGVATVISDRSPAPSTRTLSSVDLAGLRAALERADIAGLDRNYLDHQAVDAYQFDVTYQGVTVTADEGVLPPRLRPVVDRLVKLLP
jgi:hypothetical protein